jgi:CheY-like chemotaxis protein
MNKINCTLLIDDDNIANYLSKSLIKKLNICTYIEVVTNGNQALSYIVDNCMGEGKNICPQLILLDINMPGMDGFEFLNAYQELSFENKEKVIIVMLTTSTSQRDIDKLEKYTNVVNFISKPLTEEKLKQIINSHFN